MLIYEQYDNHTELTAALKPIILYQRDTNPGAQLGIGRGLAWSGFKTGLAGWPDELVAFTGRCISKLSRIINEEVEIDEIWGNILEPGGYLNPHDHNAPGNIWTGVYYLTPAVLNIMARQMFFESGEYILFPAQAIHSVDPVTVTRMSLAFNIRRRNGKT